MRNYNNALTNSLSSLTNTREVVYSEKYFTKAYQDPSAALRVSSLARSYDRIDSYYNTIQTAKNRMDGGDVAAQQMAGLVNTAMNDAGLRALNGTSSDADKKTYQAMLNELQGSLVQLANTSYNGDYIFGAAGGNVPPYSIADDGTVNYRGINVDDAAAIDAKGIMDEALYVDIGIGLVVSGGGTVASSSDDIDGATAFDMSLNGIDALGGYGTTASTTGGEPLSNNAISLIGQMADYLDDPNFDSNVFGEMVDKLQDVHGDMVDYNAEIGIRQNSLDSAESRMETEQDALAQQVQSLQYADPAEAITEYSYSQYVYNLVLKVGTNVLNSSLIDFLQ